MNKNILKQYKAIFASIFIGSVLNTAFADIPKSCKVDCVSSYGKVLGVSKRGIKSYSNCSSKCVIFDPNKVNGTYTGIKWQCVEYARRWLLVNKGAVYGDVDIASDIWDKITFLTEIKTNKKIPLKSNLNGSKQPPKVGDMLIYARAFNKTGHVAIVVDVNDKQGSIEVAEQNYSNKIWGNNYARKIKLIKSNNEYWLLDKYLLGWKHIDL